MSQPSFIRTIRERQALPAPPPESDPSAEVSSKWSQLRAYAQQALETARHYVDENNALLADNESLRREVDRLDAANSKLARENRALNAYAQSLRTRMTVIRETIVSAENEALDLATEAHEAEPEPEQIAAPEAPTAEPVKTVPPPPPMERAAAAVPTVKWGASG